MLHDQILEKLRYYSDTILRSDSYVQSEFLVMKSTSIRLCIVVLWSHINVSYATNVVYSHICTSNIKNNHSSIWFHHCSMARVREIKALRWEVGAVVPDAMRKRFIQSHHLSRKASPFLKSFSSWNAILPRIWPATLRLHDRSRSRCDHCACVLILYLPSSLTLSYRIWLHLKIFTLRSACCTIVAS